MIKKYLNRVFIDGLSGMAQGLFATLIIGTIIHQIGMLLGADATDNAVGEYLVNIGNMAKAITGAGIGVGVAVKLKSSPLTTVSAAVAGMIGAFPDMTKIDFINGRPGEPLGAFIAAYVAVEIGYLVSGKTRVEIIVTPLSCVFAGGLAGYFVGPYISMAMNWLGELVNVNVEKHPFIGGIAVSVIMGVLLTLPISSAAIGVAAKLNGLAAGAAAIGCCCNMIGFAVISFRENKTSGLVAQGIGTSMLQMPNILRRPVIWLPAILSSAILAPFSTMLFKMVNTSVGSGMGSAGLVGQFEAFSAMTDNGTGAVAALLIILLMHFVAPALVSLGISEAMRKMKWIRPGDMRLPD